MAIWLGEVGVVFKVFTSPGDVADY